MSPTWLVFFGMAPVEKVWTIGSEGKELGIQDAVAFSVTFVSIVIAYVSDKQLSDFRIKAYGGGKVNID